MKKVFVVVSMIAFALVLSACSYTSEMFGGGSASHDSYIDNNVITAKVKAALIQDPDIKNNNISVNTYHGQVQLSGYVDSKAEVKKAERIAASVPGVMKVKNQLIVKK